MAFAPTNGANGLGAGGGGAGAGDIASPAGTGGSGVVIIRYLTSEITATGGTITTDGLYTVHTFTAGGLSDFAVSYAEPEITPVELSNERSQTGYVQLVKMYYDTGLESYAATQVYHRLEPGVYTVTKRAGGLSSYITGVIDGVSQSIDFVPAAYGMAYAFTMYWLEADASITSAQTITGDSVYKALQVDTETITFTFTVAEFTSFIALGAEVGIVSPGQGGTWNTSISSSGDGGYSGGFVSLKHFKVGAYTVYLGPGAQCISYGGGAYDSIAEDSYNSIDEPTYGDITNLTYPDFTLVSIDTVGGLGGGGLGDAATTPENGQDGAILNFRGATGVSIEVGGAGGGGLVDSFYGDIAGYGGAEGGGRGGYYPSGSGRAPTQGTDGIGGGGGGGAYVDGVGYQGARGGHGRIKIAYPTGAGVCTGGTITTVGAFTVHTFDYTGANQTFEVVSVADPSAGYDDLVTATATYALTGTIAYVYKNLSLVAATSTYALTGSIAVIKKTYVLQAVTVTHSFAGQDAPLKAARKAVAQAGEYDLVGTSANVLKGSNLAGITQMYVLTGQDVALIVPNLVVLETGGFILNGTDADVLIGNVVRAATTEYDVIGEESNLLADRLVEVEEASYVLTGTPATLAKGLNFTIETADYLLDTTDAVLVFNRKVRAFGGGFVLNGTDVELVVPKVLYSETAEYNVTSAEVGIYAGALIVNDTQTYDVDFTNANIKVGREVLAVTRTYVVNGQSVDFVIRSSYTIVVEPTEYNITISTVNIIAPYLLRTETAEFNVITYVVGLKVPAKLIADTAEYVVDAIDNPLRYSGLALFDMVTETGVFNIDVDSDLVYTKYLQLETGAFRVNAVDYTLEASIIPSADEIFLQRIINAMRKSGGNTIKLGG